MPRSAKLSLYLLYVVILGVLVGFIVNSFSSDSSKTAKPPAHHQTQAKATTAKPAAPAASATRPTSSGSVDNLADTGPGDVVGLFMLASLGGVIAYRRILISRTE